MCSSDLAAGPPGGGGAAAPWGPSWPQWYPTPAIPHVPRGLWVPPDPRHSAHEALTTLRGAWAAEQVHDSVDALARALYAQLDGFAPWTRVSPPYRPTLSGLVWTPGGPRQVTVMLDTGATHCFICDRLAERLQLPQIGRAHV